MLQQGRFPLPLMLAGSIPWFCRAMVMRRSTSAGAVLGVMRLPSAEAPERAAFRAPAAPTPPSTEEAICPPKPAPFSAACCPAMPDPAPTVAHEHGFNNSCQYGGFHSEQYVFILCHSHGKLSARSGGRTVHEVLELYKGHRRFTS